MGIVGARYLPLYSSGSPGSPEESDSRTDQSGQTIRLNKVEVLPSPMDNTKVRLRGDFSLPGENIEVWFDVGEDVADGLSKSGAPWLLAMLPYGFEMGGTIEIDIPTDSLLVENLKALGFIFRRWYPELKPVELRVNSQTMRTNAEHSVGFFSGGIDSMHTVIRHLPLAGADQVGLIDELLMVWGFDIELDEPAEFAALREQVKPFVDRTGLRLQTIATNIRRPGTYWRRRWGPLTHSIGRAACAHALDRRYKKAVWAAGFRIDDAFPSGSHPMTDQYGSSNDLRISLDGSAHRRMDKVAFLAKHPWAVEDIHVCFNKAGSRNCGKCIKCVRSAIALDLAGLSDRCRTLPAITPDLVKYAYCGGAAEEVYFREMLEYAREVGRDQTADLISRAINRSRRFRPIMEFAEWTQPKPAWWRLGRLIRQGVAGY